MSCPGAVPVAVNARGVLRSRQPDERLEVNRYTADWARTGEGYDWAQLAATEQARRTETAPAHWPRSPSTCGRPSPPDRAAPGNPPPSPSRRYLARR